MTTGTKDLCDLLIARASSGTVAFDLTEAVFTDVINEVRHRFSVTFSAAELMFADARRRHEAELFEALRDSIDLAEALDAVEVCFKEQRQ